MSPQPFGAPVPASAPRGPIAPPPANLEAEQAVLSAIFLDPGAGPQATALLEEGMFSREAHRRLFGAMQAILERGGVVDPVTVKAEVDRRGEMEAVGGIEYLSYLLDVVPTAANLEHHAQIVREQAAVRHLAELGATLQREASTGRASAADLLALAQRLIGRAAAGAAPELTLAGPRVMSAAEILTHPELMQPPRTIVPRFAYTGCVTVLSALPKAGKSTLLSAITAAVSRGTPFLDGRCAAGEILWWSADLESLYRIVSRLADFDADLARVKIVITRPKDFASFLALIRAHRPSLAIVDTLPPAVAGEVTHAGSADEWLVPLTLLRDTCRATDAAVLLSHHAPRSAPTRARDSAAIEGFADIVMGMGEIPEDGDRRTIEVRARWTAASFAVVLAGNHFDLADHTPSVDAQVLACIVARPGLSGNALCDLLPANRNAVLASVKRLGSERLIENRGKTNNPAWYAVTDQTAEVVSVVSEPPGIAVVSGGIHTRRVDTTTTGGIRAPELPALPDTTQPAGLEPQ